MEVSDVIEHDETYFYDADTSIINPLDNLEPVLPEYGGNSNDQSEPHQNQPHYQYEPSFSQLLNDSYPSHSHHQTSLPEVQNDINSLVFTNNEARFTFTRRI